MLNFTLSRPLADAEIAAAIDRELDRQVNQIELIASENIVSADVLTAQGSVLTNKYAEGYPGRRYYGGCEFVDEVETLAVDRAKKLFGAAQALADTLKKGSLDIVSGGRRYRLPYDSGRPPAEGREGQGCRACARKCGTHLQQERDPVRSREACRDIRYPPRLVCRDNEGFRRSRVPEGRRAAFEGRRP